MSPEALRVLTELAELLEQPKSALVAELVDAALPALHTTVQAVKVAKEQPREAQRLVANFANDAIAKVAQAQLELDAAVDARTVKGKRAKSGGGGRGRTP